MSCVHCDDTGSLSKALDGYLDCGHCDVAEQRRDLEAWAHRKVAEHGAAAAIWLAYQHGKAEAAAAVQTQAASAPRHVPQPRMVERKCAWCKGPFEARAADVARGWGKFCSKSCKASKQESCTGQYRALQERDDDEHGHVFDSGYFGHGQN